jgi:NAD(P)-dependent dehydrogenase (short-subunit alcohol dehydrogenase family)
MDLKGKAALITGARRIGIEIARELARRGMDVALSYNRSKEEAETGASAIREQGRRAYIASANVSNPDDCRRLVNDAAAEFGRLDVLINMASLYSAVPFDELDVTAWDRQLGVDLRASFLCSSAAIPHMRKAGGGRIVNFSDWLAVSGRPRYKGFVPYYVAKRAILGLTEILALELAKDQILVNAIAPGPILAPPGTTEEESKEVAAATPLGRWGGEAEIVKAVCFLLESDFVTGDAIRVDGGRHIH